MASIAPIIGQLALSSIMGNKVDPMLMGTPYGSGLGAALDFRQPVMNAVMGVNDERAIMEMLMYLLMGRVNKPVSGRALPVMPRNSSAVVDPAQQRVQQLYNAL